MKKKIFTNFLFFVKIFECFAFYLFCTIGFSFYLFFFFYMTIIFVTYIFRHFIFVVVFSLTNSYLAISVRRINFFSLQPSIFRIKSCFVFFVIPAYQINKENSHFATSPYIYNYTYIILLALSRHTPRHFLRKGTFEKNTEKK